VTRDPYAGVTVSSGAGCVGWT